MPQTPTLTGCFRAQCPSCGTIFGWTGRMTSRPPCSCGHRQPIAELEREERDLAELLAPLTTNPETTDAR